MALDIGKMSEAIYKQLEESLKNGVESGREGRKRLSYAIAKGVITHIKENADVIEVSVDPASHTQTNKGKIE